VSIVPTVELPPEILLTCQVATVLVKFDMVAVHCVWASAFKEVLAQVMVIAGVAAVLLEPQEFNTSTDGRRAKMKRKCQRVFQAQIYPFD
jgi:hypothetical protein